MKDPFTADYFVEVLYSQHRLLLGELHIGSHWPSLVYNIKYYKIFEVKITCACSVMSFQRVTLCPETKVCQRQLHKQDHKECLPKMQISF